MLVVINDEVHAARSVIKTNTTSVEAFESPNRGAAGLVHTGKVTWFEPMDKKHTHRSEFSLEEVENLPRVDILYAHANMSADLMEAAMKNGARGLVIAGVGDGNMSQQALEVLAKAVKQGVAAVRSSRLMSGLVPRKSEVDDALGLVASGELNPAKSRVLLQLALTRTKDPAQLQRYFQEY